MRPDATLTRFTKVLAILLLAAPGRAQTVADPPEAHSPVALGAVVDKESGRAAFTFEGKEQAPVIRANPGESIKVTYKNSMPAGGGKCATGPCMNMTNLHFHGLHVSPNAPQDDVLTMMAMPGESLEYTVDVPRNQPPGLYWYHTHPHGESFRQVRDGMSGAIVIEGIGRYVPEIRSLRERILILRDLISKAPAEESERGFTVNGMVRPKIPIAAGERQFWRIVNASPNLYADLQIDGEQWEIVALDGMPLAYHDPNCRTRFARHVLLPPAGRLEAIVTGPRAGAGARLRTLNFATGPDGDPNPEMVLADLVNVKVDSKAKPVSSADNQQPVYEVVPEKKLVEVEDHATEFTVTFTEDKQGFYINDKKYGPNDAPMTVVRVGGYHRWRVVNKTHEVHPFHIHQVHFLVYAMNGKRLREPQWLDTVNVPLDGSVDLVMDFSDPIIRGVSLFHCHLLSHEDKGMMAKILFQ